MPNQNQNSNKTELNQGNEQDLEGANQRVELEEEEDQMSTKI